MDLEFSEEQHLLKDMTRSMLQEYSSIETIREIEDDPKGYPDELWKQLGELGLTGILIPESYGGGELSLLDASLIYKEFGRAMAPTPHFVSAVMSASVLLAAGSDEQKQAWLPGIASGDAIVTQAWLEPDRGYGPKGVAMTATSDGDDFVLNGTKRHVYFGSAANQWIVLARSDAGIDLFLVDPSSDGITMEQQLSQSSDSQYRAVFENVRVSSSDRCDARRHHPPCRPGHWRGREGPGDHRRIRQDPKAIRQTPGRVPVTGPLHGRLLHHHRGWTCARLRSGVEPDPGPVDFAVRTHGEALLL